MRSAAMRFFSDNAAAACPAVTFVLQHAGMPEDLSDRGWEQWRAGMNRLAAQPPTSSGNPSPRSPALAVVRCSSRGSRPA